MNFTFFWTVGKSVADMMTLLNTLAYMCAFSYNDLLTFFFYIFVVNICSNLLLASDSSLVFLRWWHAMPCQHPDHGAIWHGTDWGGGPALLWACTQAPRAGRGLTASLGKIVVSHGSHHCTVLHSPSPSLYPLGHLLIPARFWFSSVMTSSWMLSLSRLESKG